jgi:UDP-2,3-diacylglucosamine hydrolase
MIDVVFISDLHLSPEDLAIDARFNAFIKWMQDMSVKQLYILGDFFHVWSGDDAIDAWSLKIAAQIKQLNIPVYYMAGNRDFLLGKKYASHAGWTVISEPHILQLGSEPILLVHGDRYCTKDVAHQRFRALTRNAVFRTLFLMLPLGLRQRLVASVKARSQNNRTKTMEEMDVVPESVVEHMNQQHVSTLIHGHTHKPGLSVYDNGLKRYVLSDWDDNPQLLCYDNTKGFYFDRM